MGEKVEVSEPPLSGSGAPLERESISVLLVQDHAEDAQLITSLLSRCTHPSFCVSVAPTVAVALPVVDRHDYDVVLLDLSLPDALGLAGARELALAVPRLPIVILTGMDGQALAVAAIRHGAQDYIVKSASDTGVLARSIRMAIERKAFEAELAQRANFDPLTGLVNRTLFRDRLIRAIARAKRRRERVALLFIDLDGFKAVNDGLGHAIGDEVLRIVADKFRSTVRESETLARFGGDEFTILIEPLPDAESVFKAAERIREALQAPLVVEHKRVHITPSIGIAIFPDDAPDADALLRNADAAMLRAKKLGRNNIQVFSVSRR